MPTQTPTKIVEVPDAPKLLVEWTPRWKEFVASIGPALARSERRLAGEAPFGLVPLRIMIPSYVLEAFAIAALLFVQVKIAELRPYVAPRIASHDVIYYSGEELPRTQDLGGTEAGNSGRAGGDEAHHRTQTIKIARGGSLVPKVVDAPNLKLPSSQDAVANLLAVKPNPGPPPSEGLRSNRAAPNLAANVVAPAPNAIRDYTRNGVQFDAVIAPAPNVAADRTLTMPNLSAILVPPAPQVPNDHTLVAPALAPIVIPPAPNVARGRAHSPSFNPAVIAPAPSLVSNPTTGHARTASALADNVIPPAPSGISREISSSPVQMTNAAVIPPPVSAPERASARNSKLNLPAPSVIAPPPSSQVSQDVHRLAAGSVPDATKTVVPPPPTQSATASFMSGLIGKIFGAAEVVPPPPSVQSDRPSSAASSLSANVVPPPPTAAISMASGNKRGGGNGTSLGANVVAPPPTAGLSSTIGRRSLASSSASTVGTPNVVAPPPSVTGAGGGLPGGTLLANAIVPPPPSVGGSTTPSGSGLGHRGAGLGAPLDPGAGLAPPNTGGSGANAGAVLSSQPGPKLALPNSSTGSLAMAPAGGDKLGIGGAEGGTGIGRGNGPGSGMNGAGAGAAKSGTEHGSDAAAHGGISPAAGPGGAGNVPSGTPAVRGVDISGGSSQVTLPAFGSNDAASDAQTPGRTSIKRAQTFDVDIVATANSGGAFAPYRNLLHGEKHTIYPETSSSLGVAAMEYAESVTGRGAFAPPQSIRTSLPEGLPHARMVVTCILDTSGNLKGVRVLEAGPAEMTAKVVAALRSWKFQPAMRGDQPVEVTAILGFGIDTNDRF
jgi:TonB family protein